MNFKNKSLLRIFWLTLSFAIILSEEIVDNRNEDEDMPEEVIYDLSKFESVYKISQNNETDNRLFSSMQQKCVTNEGRPGFCKVGVCLNLIDKKPVYCQTSSSYHMKCCPTTGRSAVLLYQESSKYFITNTNNNNIDLVCGLRPNNFFIVGGAEAPPHSYPWAVAIYQITKSPKKAKSRFICGGTIISKWYVLTAAHCIIRQTETLVPSNFKLLVGAHSNKDTGFYADVQEIKVHENFIFGQHKNDIALFKLSKPLDFKHDKHMGPVCLPPPAIEGADLVGTMGTLVGWGTTSQGGKPSPVLQEVEVPISDLDDCAMRYSPLLGISDQIDGHQLCASYPRGGKDSCQGDSGGSLTVSYSGRYYQLGIVSFGKGCAQAGYPGVYTRVSSFLYWIGAHSEE